MSCLLWLNIHYWNKINKDGIIDIEDGDQRH